MILATTVAGYGPVASAAPRPAPPTGGSAAADSGPDALRSDFAAAAEEFHVPAAVLMAVSYRQTLWESHGGQPSTTGNYNVMGLTLVRPQDLARPATSDRLSRMNLSGDPSVTGHFSADRALASGSAAVDTTSPRMHTLKDAAELIGRPADELRTDRRQNIRGAAALLARYEQDAYGSLPADPGRWYAAVARYSQSPDASGAEQFARRVFSSVRTGESRLTGDGQRVTLDPDPSVRPAAAPVPAGSAAPQPPVPGAAPPATTPASPPETTPAWTPAPETTGPGTAPPASTPPATTGPGTALPSTGPTTAPPTTAATPPADCPTTLACSFVPAAFAKAGTAADDFGNYNPADRPASGEDIRYIVIHDMEGTFEGTITEFQNAASYASAHYLVADDGRVTQMVQTKDEAWHSGNKTVNMHSIGIEHEGFAMKAGQWYAEPEYDSSAALVGYLAGKFGIPLDRQHIIGHDEVPGVLDASVATQHWDPGPYWDWNHYMALLGRPQGDQGTGGPVRAGRLVRIVPPYTTENQPVLTSGGKAFAAHPANFVYLYEEASATAARPTDPYLGSKPLWSEGSNWSNKAVAGSTYVVAEQSGTDWTAIWYGGRKLWFANPGGRYTVPVTAGDQTVVAPRAGAASVPVYGRAYPESAAYAPLKVPVQTSNDASLTSYTIAAGQAYAQAGPETVGDYYYAGTFAGTAAGDRTLVTGGTTFYPIEYNHRIAWVRASDVQLLDAGAADPAAAGASADPGAPAAPGTTAPSTSGTG